MRKARSLDSRLEATATPVFVIDAERRIRAFNRGCEMLTGWTAAEALGQVCHYGSLGHETGVPALAASLCPPPEAFAGEDTAAPTYIICKDGASQARMLHFFPLRSEGNDLTGVLGVALPIKQPLAASRISPARQLHAELAALRTVVRARFGAESLVCSSPAMRKVLTQVELARQSAVSVLLAGEPGTGREHLARTIHFGSSAKASWFVPLDCRRLGAEDLQSVLSRLLEVHQARPVSGVGPQPGTLYLADVECLPRDMQEGLTTAFSNPAALNPRLRILASTSGDLEAAIDAETLRPDFAAMLSTMTIEIPPLREREGDVLLLAQHLLEEVNRLGGKQLGGFDDDVWPLFQRYNWPGNIDELAQVVREAHERCGEALVKAQDLPFRFRTALGAQELPPPAEPFPLALDPLLIQVEAKLIVQALDRSKHNKSKAAELLGINRARLYRRMQQLGIEDREG